MPQCSKAMKRNGSSGRTRTELPFCKQLMSRKFLKTRCPAISHIQQISLFSQRLVQNLVQNLPRANRVFSIEENEPFNERCKHTAFGRNREDEWMEST